MSKTRAWAVVEGKSVDAPFYDGVMSEIFGDREFEIIGAEDIEIDGVSAGGKSSIVKAFRYFEGEDSLRQSNNSTTVDWIFFLDRDDDDFQRKVIESPHVVYTAHADVEAEVLSSTDITQVVSMAYSLPKAAVREAALGNPLVDLGRLWQQWITLRLTVGICGAGGGRFSQTSQVNSPVYGEFDERLFTAIIDRSSAEVGEAVWETHFAVAERYVADRVRVGDISKCVKGKWVPTYVAHVLRMALEDRYYIPKVSSAHLLSVGVARLDFSASWADHYREHLGELSAA